MKSKRSARKSIKSRLDARNRKLSFEHCEERRLLTILSNAPGDGTLVVDIDGYGAFGEGVAGNAGDAFFDPVGPIGPAGTVFESGIAVRFGTTGPRDFLTSGDIDGQGFLMEPGTSGSLTSVTSTFGTGGTVPATSWQLDQVISPLLNPSDERVGTLLTQTYTITNVSGETQDLNIVRYLDGDLEFDGTVTDGGGHRNTAAGSLVYETDTADLDTTETNLVGIQALGGTQDGYEVSQYNQLVNRIQAGGALTDSVQGDGADEDEAVDVGNSYDVSLALSNSFTIADGATVTYITRTFFGALAPEEIVPPQDATVTGVKWHDLNEDGVRQDNEPGIGGWEIFVDLDENGTHDPGEPRATTSSSGAYVIDGLSPGDYVIAETQQANWMQTFPTTNGGTHMVTLADGEVLPDIDFGNRDQAAIVSGVKFGDFNGNGQMDADEMPLEGWTIFSDLNGNGSLDTDEPSDVTGADGVYTLSVSPGMHTILEVQQANWQQTQPASGSYQLTLDVRELSEGNDFGNDPDPATVSGIKWSDENGNGVFDSDEQLLPGFTIYIDENGDNELGPGEPSVITNGSGSYTFPDLNPGSYNVREEPLLGWDQTFPAENGGHAVVVDAGDAITERNFGNRAQDGIVSGRKWSDLDEDGAQDPNEPGVANFYIFADLNEDTIPSVGEPGAFTNAQGFYEIPGLRPGTYTLREVPQPGWEQTFPFSGEPHVTSVGPGGTNTGIDFGNTPARDFGDAPFPFASTSETNGASHGVLTGFYLGAGVDREDNAFVSDSAVGDDINGIDDEDGIVLTSPIAPGITTTMEVTVATANNAPGYLQGWIDFNQNGSWADPGEQIISNMILPTGVHQLSFTSPQHTELGETFARFRYSQEFDISFTGEAIAGEVEDYQFVVLGDSAQALDDEFIVDTNSSDNALDVLANDSPSFSVYDSGLTVIDITEPAAGGTAVLDTNGTLLDTSDDVIRYSAPGDFVGTDTFFYTVVDAAGELATAMVTVHIEFPPDPIALDNTFFVDRNSSENLFDVLANDLTGDNPPITVIAVEGASNGTASVSNGGANVTYTPAPNFAGPDQFIYRVRDTLGETDTATVTVHVGNGTLDDVVSIDLQVTDVDGVPFANNEVPLGTTFLVSAYVEDVRDDVPAFDLGVFSTYFDLLYNSFATSVGDVTFSDDYNGAANFRPFTPGIVDEVGSLQSTPPGGGVATPLGPGQHMLFSMEFSADRIGQTTFTADPADILPLHETLVNLPGMASIDFAQITFDQETISITPSADMAAIRVETTTLDDVPVSTVLVGSQFKVKAFIQDIRQPALLNRGLFSFYSDLTFNPSVVSAGTIPAGGLDITFHDNYTVARNAILEDGLIDEVGAVQEPGSIPLGPGEVLLYEVVFTADAAGTSAFRTNPADDLPLHEISVNVPPSSVNPALVQYGSSIVTVVTSDTPFQNAKNALDVNDDDAVSPIDALLGINKLNTDGAGPLVGGAVGSGEGEDAAEGEDDQLFYDTSGDNFHSALDILLVINHLNNENGVVVAAGEGEPNLGARGLGEVDSSSAGFNIFLLPNQPTATLPTQEELPLDSLESTVERALDTWTLPTKRTDASTQDSSDVTRNSAQDDSQDSFEALLDDLAADTGRQ